jgi:hypothetical protein
MEQPYPGAQQNQEKAFVRQSMPAGSKFAAKFA